MERLLNPAIVVGPVALSLGLLVALACCVIYLSTARSRKSASVLRYILVAVALGAVAFVTGTALGIAAFCSSGNSGNLCGLGGVFGVGPLLSGICIGGYGYFWLRGTRNAA